MTLHRYTLILPILVLAVGCNQKKEQASENQVSPPSEAAIEQKVFDPIAEPKGPNCKEGGWKYSFGIDSNKDGILSGEEITMIKYVCNGLNGERGPVGLQGTQGNQGLTGPQGQPGPQGPVGLTGLSGAPGSPGAKGPQGIQGPAGPQGTSIFPVAGYFKLSESRRIMEPSQIVSGSTSVKEASLVLLPQSITIKGAEKATSSTNGWLSLKLDQTLFCYTRAVGATAFTLKKQKNIGSQFGCESSTDDSEALNSQIFVARDSQIEFTINSPLKPSNCMFTHNLILNAMQFRQQ